MAFAKDRHERHEAVQQRQQKPCFFQESGTDMDEFFDKGLDVIIYRSVEIRGVMKGLSRVLGVMMVCGCGALMMSTQ